ncbi:MAG: transporter [Gammaproteobacteria bacterium]|nr:transporter [Gammaproteobacteria bacterium]
MPQTTKTPRLDTKLIAVLAVGGLLCAPPAVADDGAAGGHEAESSSSFSLDRQATWLFRSFLPDESDDADTVGFEFESSFGIGRYDVKNIAYVELNDYPRAIPGQPIGNPEPGVEAATGIGDILTGFWFSRKGAHHGAHHLSFGFGAQLPTASDDTLGSGKWSIGPSFDYEYENGRLFAGAIAMQIWSVAGDSDRKDVSMLIVKPFVYYTLNDNWDLIYVPYGISVYWDKPSGEKVYLPVGGGAQRKFKFESVEMNLGAALYLNAVRPTKGTKWDLRFILEFQF